MRMNMRKIPLICASAALIAFAGLVTKAASAPKKSVGAQGKPTESESMRLPVKEIRLENGLVILVVERKGAPVFASYIVTAVGSANEKPGAIGAAHFLEHMLFKGTQRIGTRDYTAEQELMDKQDSVWNHIDRARHELRYARLSGDTTKIAAHERKTGNLEALLDSLVADESLFVVKNEYEAMYTRRGAVGFNASTGYDFTDYIVSFPSNQLETWFVTEADRMKRPVLREFYAERDVILEERRMRVDNEGEGKLFEQFIGTAFVAHPYQLFWEWASDQGNIKRETLEAFHRQFYAPNRTAVALVGNISYTEVKTFAEKYWTDIPRQSEPDPVYTVEPEQTGERRVSVTFDATPALYIGYHKGAFDNPDEPVFALLERILADGRSSRLYKKLVTEWQLCSDISVATFPGAEQGDVYPNLFYISAYPKEGVESRLVEDSVYSVLRTLTATPVTERELAKARNNFESDFIWSFDNSSGLAAKLAQYESTAHDWRFMLTRLAAVRAVAAKDISRVAQSYFTQQNRTVATLIPAEMTPAVTEAKSK